MQLLFEDAIREALDAVHPKKKGADLFAGCGGSTTGAKQAARRLGCDVEVVALNHWNVAISTHGLNYPTDRHMMADIQGVDPREVVPEGRLDFLVASPECVYFSKARGGKPVNDQRRSSAGYVLRWLRRLDIQEVMIENVQEFEQWGPLYPKGHPKEDTPIPERAGELFQRFVHRLKQCGYRHVEWRVLRAADYGDPTTRERFFLRASKVSQIVWPAPTHTKEQWIPARQIIDWSQQGHSIYGRSKRLAENTMKRILTGFEKYSGLQPYLVPNFGEREGQAPRTHSVDAPLPTVTSHGAGCVAQPYLVRYNGNRPGQEDGHKRSQSLALPLSTVDTSNRFAMADPCLVVLRNHADSRSLDEPVPALCADGQHFGVAEFHPWLINNKGQSDAADAGKPAPTITAHAQHLAVGEPCLIHMNEGIERRVSDLSDPLPTVMAGATRFGVAQPYLTHLYGGHDAKPVDDTLPTVTANYQHFWVADPYLTKYYGACEHGASVHEPLDTVTTKGRFGVAQPALFDDGASHLVQALQDDDPLYRPPIVEIDGERYLVDIRYRMLSPRELANAHSFPPDYKFTGTLGDQVRQVGNSVPCRLAEAICYEMLKGAPTHG